MKILKKTLAVILTAIMLFSMIPFTGLQLKASAGTNGYTAEQAVKWAYDRRGTKVGTGECVDLINYYYNYLGYSAPYSGVNYGKDFATADSPLSVTGYSWQRIPYYDGFVARKGDIAIWTWNSWAGNYGHVAIVDDANSSGMTYYDQGRSYGYVVNHRTTYLSYHDSNWTFWGVIRPDFTPVVAPKVNIDKPLNTLNSETIFSFENVSSASSVHLYIYHGTNLYFEGQFGIDAKYSRKFVETGHYSCYIVAHYPGYDVESGWQGFDIVESMDSYLPQKPTLYAKINSVNVNYANPNEEVTFYHWSEKASKYTFLIYKNNAKITETNIYTGTHNETFTETGQYLIMVRADNSYGSSEFAQMNFNVGVYNVKYYDNIQEETFLSQTKVHNTDFTISNSTPQRENYIFKEWNTQPDGTGTSYAPGDTYSTNADLTLYAIWKPACNHEYSSEITVQPECTKVGERTYTCPKCGDTYTEAIPALGHDYEKTITSPTCTEHGYTNHACSRCEDFYIDTYTEPLNHSSSRWVTAVNPTATSDGLAEKRCDYCNEVLDSFVIPHLAPDYVTGITISSENEIVGVGDSFSLTAEVTPDTAKNKNIIWSSRNPNIATVDNGTVKAIKPGTTAITVESQDGCFMKFCLVRVISLTSINGAVIDNQKNLIYGLTAQLDSVDKYLELVDENMHIELSSSTVGTGTTINVVSDGEIIDTYDAVIFGDVNSDGIYDGMDAMIVNCIANGMLTKEQVGEAVYMAADCNHDGVIDDNDVKLLEQAGLLLESVDQNKSQEELKTDSDYIEYLNLIEQNVADEVNTEENSSELYGIVGFLADIYSFVKNIIAFLKSILI